MEYTNNFETMHTFCFPGILIHFGFSQQCTSGEHFMKLFVSDFYRQMLKATEVLASDWPKANLLAKIIDKMLNETLSWNPD